VAGLDASRVRSRAVRHGHRPAAEPTHSERARCLRAVSNRFSCARARLDGLSTLSTGGRTQASAARFSCSTVTAMTSAAPVPDDTLLTPAEERELALLMEAGVLASEALDCGSPVPASEAELRCLVELGEQARQRFVAANLRLVRMVAAQWSRRSGIPYADLVQEGMVGLLIAIQRYDHAKGWRFSTYGLHWIRAQVSLAAARTLGGSGLPTSRAEHLRQTRGLEMELTQRLGRNPTVDELAEILGKPPLWVESLLAHQPPRPMEDVDPDLFPSTDDFDRVASADRPGAELLALLEPEARRVLQLRLGFVGGEPRSQAEVARTLGWPISRARRVERKALEDLRAVCPQSAVAHL
jgi:RNA polymerase primary sigma factor